MGQGKGYEEGAGSRLRTWLSGRGEWRKRRADLVGVLRRLRETKAASRVKGARGHCGGWRRCFERLRRVKEEVHKMGFCACVEVGLRRGFSLLREDGFQSLQHACARLSLLG